MQTNFDNELQNYFTNVEQLRQLFKQYIVAPALPKRLLIIWGVGGVGKSSLIRMFRLQCKTVNVPVAIASGDEEKFVLDVLERWVMGLKLDGIVFPLFSKTFEHYREIRSKVDAHAKKAAGGRMADIAGKAASKTAEAAGSALAGAAIGSFIPGIGTAIGGALGGVLGGLGGIGAEALVDWLRGFLTKTDIDLLLDPAKKLTDDFLVDLAKFTKKKRVVLILDTFEQMIMLDDWACEVAQRLQPNALLVIAGRALPNWNRTWQDWMTNAHVEELKPMTEEVMRDLVRRYYTTMRGGKPNPTQVEAIIRFARGLPMVVTSAVQLWVKYGVEDFQSVKVEIVANLVDQLMEGVPNALIPVLEAAAIVRWFDQPILRAVTGLDDVRDVYNELRQFPFVRVRTEGLALHDTVREIIDENLRSQDSERHFKLHERAAVLFEKRLEKATSEGTERLELERLYHRVQANEEAGIKLFQEMAEPLARYQFVGRLRILINDVNSYQLDDLNSQLWREYYNARLLHINVQFSEAERIYTKISEDEHAEPKLRAYALCDLSQIWTGNLSQPDGLERVFSAIEKSQQLIPEMDSKLALNFSHLRYAYMFNGDLGKALDVLRQQYDFYKRIGDKNGTVYSLDMLKDIYGLLGNWKMAAIVENEGLEILKLMPLNSFLQTRLVGHNIWYKIWSGRYSEGEKGIRQALALAEKEEQIDSFPGLQRDLGLVLGLQRRWKQSQEYFVESIKKYQERGGRSTGSTQGFWGLILSHQGEFQNAQLHLLESLSIKKDIQDNNGIPEILVWLGQLSEMMAKKAILEDRNEHLAQAESYYNQSLEYSWTSRRYFECSALTALARIKYLRDDYDNAVILSGQAERIAEEHQYHDLIASLHLLKGHCQWSVTIDSMSSSFDAAQLSYKRALLQSLSYNRFLLDEMIWVDQVSTPLINIVSKCILQGLEGRKMLEDLINWWKTATYEMPLDIIDNDMAADINNVPLTQAERLVRQREPGNGEPQLSVIETLNRFLR